MQTKTIELRITVTDTNTVYYQTWIVVPNGDHVSVYFGTNYIEAKDKAIALRGTLGSAGVLSEIIDLTL